MIRPRLPLTLALMTFAAPALAQEVNLNPAAPLTSGHVAQITLAQDLYALGLARRDALTVLAAARMVAGLRFQPVDRAPTSEGAAEGDTPASPLPDAAAMLEQARLLAAEDDRLIGLIDDALVEATRGRIGVAEVTEAVLAPGQRDIWELPSFGDAYAEVAVMGDGSAELRVEVKDEGGATICAEASASAQAYCNFVPAWNGYFYVTVENRGDVRATYAILTN